MSTPEDRQWSQLFHRLDRIDDKLDSKISRSEFKEHENETDKRMERIEFSIKELENAAITPEQVSTMIDTGMKASSARGITSRERWIRYAVAISSIATGVFLFVDKIAGKI